MRDLLSLLNRGLQLSGQARTAKTLGDRAKYVGLSDIGKAADCLRFAVANKLCSPSSTAPGELANPRHNHETLLRELRLQRGHWFEQGIAEALHATGTPILRQMRIQTRHNQVPIAAHLDFVLIAEDETPRVQIVELKSCEHIPKIAYAAHEVQLGGQIGLLQTLWNRPCFQTQPGALLAFPELVRQSCNLDLPESADDVIIEGVILMVSMNEIKSFGPYTPNRIMLDVCLNLAEQVWENTEQVRTGKLDLNQLLTAGAFHPLCDWCEWNADCPRFAPEFGGLSAVECEDALVELQRLKTEKEAAALRVSEVENRLKKTFQGICPGRGWVNAATQRFRVGTCEGRKILDKDRLFSALAACMTDNQAQAVVQAGYKTGEAYERLYVSPINGL